MLSRAIHRLLISVLIIFALMFLLRLRHQSRDIDDEWDFDGPSALRTSAEQPPDQYTPPQKAWLYPPHRRLRNGLVETNLRGRHPIVDLIEKGERIWKHRIEHQSKTLKNAVKEYKKRYRRPPPKGFDKWWKFVQDNGVVLVDEFDQIHRNIEPYFALSPKVFQSRVKELVEHLPFSFNITISGGVLTLGGERAAHIRARDIKSLIQPFAHLLPDLVMHASDHDKGNIVLGRDQYDRALELASEGSYFTNEELQYFENLHRNDQPKLLSACHPYSNAIRRPPPETNSSHTFLEDPLSAMDYCADPSLKELHGTWAFDHARESRLTPMFVHCKWLLDHSFLMPALPGFGDVIRDPLKVVPWSDRRDSRLFWRARSTGVDFHTGRNWRQAHRIRLHFHSNNKTGSVELLQEGHNEYGDGADDTSSSQDYEMEKIAGTGVHGSLRTVSYSRDELVEKYLDVGLVKPLVQCSEPPPFCDDVTNEIGFLETVPQSQGQDVKFVIDVDGNGWSQRYARLLSTGSVVFKSTIFPEWNTDWLVPWYHYVPVKVDYSDLFDIMAFFVGWPDGTPGHDDLGEQIGANAVRFVREHWRWEDMQAYMFRLLLEYARLASPDREEASYNG